ncbi:uncharacterized protein EKO05_0011198 [Ascochyta rabiei]|nr:uncharacterized protein EKO05_0011198 [Ascochyta rabiei]UPX20992.1 hypothetical protein EKO05_0011198 [Ascochyta rabiei]
MPPILNILAYGRGEVIDDRPAAPDRPIDREKIENSAKSKRTAPAEAYNVPVYVEGMSTWSNGRLLISQEPWRGDQIRARTADWIDNDLHERGVRHLATRQETPESEWFSSTLTPRHGSAANPFVKPSNPATAEPLSTSVVERLHLEQRRDSTQPTEAQIRPGRRHSINEGRVSAAGTMSGPGARRQSSASMPELRSLPDYRNDDGLLLASEETATEEETLLATQPDTVPDTDGNVNGALASNTFLHTLPADLGADGDGCGEAVASLPGPFDLDGMIPPSVLEHGALIANRTRVPNNSLTNT